MDEENNPPIEEPTPKPNKKAALKKVAKAKKQKATKAKNKEKSIKQILREKQRAEERKNKFTSEDQLSRLEKYDLEDSNDPDNNQFIADEKFKGPAPYRKSTDWIWILLFIVLNLGLGATAFLAITNGDLNRLINGYDFRSVLCGVDQFVDKPYLYFINPVMDINVAICVKHCPKKTGDTICLYKRDGITPTSFCYVQMQTTYNGRYCYPVEPINHRLVDTFLNSFYNSVKRTVADFFFAKEVIAYGIILAVFLPLLILFLLKHQKTVAVVAWGSIFGTIMVIGGMAYLFYTEYQNQMTLSCPFSQNSDCAGWKPKLYYAMFIIVCAAGGFYLLAILRLLGRINLAIGILKAASKTTEVLTQLRIIPIVMTFLGLSFGSLTVFITLKSFGCGEVFVISAKNIDGGEVKTIFWSAYIQWLIVYNILMLFYWLLAILGYSDLITSYALAIWFFVKNKDTVNIPVKRSFRDITKYHLGTLFFGSCANTVFGIPKMIMGFVTMLLRKSKQHRDSVRFMSATCMCCIHVYQKLLRYISKNALVQTSLWGDDYYHSAKKAYFLLFRNAHLTKDLDYLQSFLILQTKLCVCFVSSSCTYVYLSFFDKSYIFGESLEDLESPFAPTIIVFFIAFFLSSIIQGSFDITSKTIIQCYLIDCEMFMGEQRYSEDFIRHFMEFFVKSSQKKIFIQSTKKAEKSLNTVNKDEESVESSQDQTEKKDEEEEEDEEIEEEEEEEDEEDDEDDEDEEESEGNSEISEEADDDEKKEHEEDLENGQTDTIKSKNFMEDAPDEKVEFYDNPNDDKESEGDSNSNNEIHEEETKENKQNLNLNTNPSLNSPLNNMSNNNPMNNNNNSMKNNPFNNSMNNQAENRNSKFENNNNSFIQTNKAMAGDMSNPRVMNPHGIDESTPLKGKEKDEWNLVNLNNQSYDDIKNQVFNLMGDNKQEKSFNFFDKSQINDMTWKFEDPFDMQPSKNYRPY